MNKFLFSFALTLNVAIASGSSFQFELDDKWLNSKESKLLFEEDKVRGRLDLSRKDYIDFKLYKEKYGRNKGKANGRVELKTPLGKLNISK